MICENCRKRAEDVVYAQRRSNLVERAAFHADRLHGKTGPSAEVDESGFQLWVEKWNGTFHSEMNRLSKAAGL